MGAKLNILGILPVRGGSKGVPGKNKKILCGAPLMSWAAKALKNSSVSRAICSTDDPELAEIALEYGLEVPFVRPTQLAGDKSMVSDVILHALDSLDDVSNPFSHVIVVQATTPTVSKDHIDCVINMLADDETDTVISGFKLNAHHPSIMYYLDGSGKATPLLGSDSFEKRRQDFADIYVRTGAVYACRTNIVREKRSIYGENIRSIILNEAETVAIDIESDFQAAERIMRND